jgi:hypothetical protein
MLLALYGRVWRGNDMNAKRLGKLLAFAGAVIGLGTTPGFSEGLAHRGLAQDDQGTEPGIPNGTYAFRVSGYLPAGPSGSSLVPLAAAGYIIFSADGTTSGVLTASINGQISPITVHGTWTINPDGSISETEFQTGGPGQTVHFKDYPTLDGNTITIVATDPGSTVSGISTRGSPAGNEQ